jgi:hypothetical protein
MKNIALVIASVLLLFALLDGWPYEFFTILRFVVCGSSTYVAWLSYKDGQENWTWILGAIALLFNPFLPIYLTREIWVVIDSATAVLLIVAIFGLKLGNKEQDNG